MDDTGDQHDGRWLSYAELAAVRGINRASAVKLVQRERWRRSSGNDRARTVKVLVPPNWLAPAKERPVSSGDAPGMPHGQSGEDTRHLVATIASLTNAFDVALTALREQLTAAEAGRGQAETTITELRGQLEQLQAQLAEAQAAVQRVEELKRADVARQARGRLARAWAAWRGR